MYLVVTDPVLRPLIRVLADRTKENRLTHVRAVRVAVYTMIVGQLINEEVL